MLALFVQLQIKPDKRESFLAAIAENAEASVRNEPGCLRFDVAEDSDNPNSFVFYEVYKDAAAFDVHRAAPHFARWREVAAECLIAGSQANTLSRLLFSNQEHL